MKKIFLSLATVALIFASCSDSFLTRNPAGGSLTQEQFDALSSEKLQGTLKGLYSMIYTMSGSDHDEFGQRSIDLWGDILCGDIAVTNKTYGWLYQDEQMLTVSNRTGTIWVFYYDLIHNINTTVKGINTSSDDLMGKIAKYGYPSKATEYEYTSEETNYALYLAQALALRAYCYGNLIRWYTPTVEALENVGYTIDDYASIPVYTETNMDSPQPLSKSADVYAQVFKDLTNSITLFEEFGAYYEKLNGSAYTRETKLEINVNVARGLLAYDYLNAAPYYYKIDANKEKSYYRAALKYADEVIKSGEFRVIPNSMLYTTGFNNVDEPSWMWGQNVVTETAGGLRSWFGQCDIHSYSYAWAGDTKVLDDNLKMLLEPWDGRSGWFNDGSKNSKFKDCPDGKFFSEQNPTSTKEEDIDREWLSDNVFMRIESMYLIAAEACYFLDSFNLCKDYLNGITAERLNLSYPDALTEHNAYINGLAGDKLKEAIIYNWRIEMWGEGYGLQTFRRLTKNTKRGNNHDYSGGTEVNADDTRFNMNIPSSEATYNPNI